MMHHFRIVLALSLVYVCCIHAQITNPVKLCNLVVNVGKNCTTAKPSVRFHLDKKTQMCMAFKYNGCGGNKNNFKTVDECRRACIPMGIEMCPANTKQGKECSSNDDCQPTESCQFQTSMIGMCCRKVVQNKINADFDGKCGKNQKLVKINDWEWLIGKNCKAQFCPKGATCKNGNFFATCCVKK